MSCHGRAGTCLLLLDFFGASTLAFFRISSSVELWAPYPELRFLVFCRIRFCMDGSYGFRARKMFSVALFLVVSGRLVSGPAFLSISGISISAFLFGVLFNGTCHAKTAPEKFCCHSILGFLACWSSVRRLFCDIRNFDFAFLSRIRFNGTRQAKLALGKFCGHSMLGFFLYGSVFGRVRSPLRLSSPLLFSSSRPSPFGGRPGGGLSPGSAPLSCCTQVTDST